MILVSRNPCLLPRRKTTLKDFTRTSLGKRIRLRRPGTIIPLPMVTSKYKLDTLFDTSAVTRHENLSLLHEHDTFSLGLNVWSDPSRRSN